MRTKIFKTNCRSCQSHHTILKQEAKSLRKENRSLLTAIRLMSNGLQNPNEGNCAPVTSTNLHEQISECVNGVSPMHDKESPWVPVNNAKSKQRSKRKSSKKAKLTATANPAEPHRPLIEQNQSSHQNRETPNAAQQIQNPSFLVSCGTPSTDHMAKKKLVFIAGDSIIQHVQGWDLSTNDKDIGVKSFSGARIAHMDDYSRPLLRKKPDEIILHVGTNNIRDESPRRVDEGIVNLGNSDPTRFPDYTPCNFISATQVR